MRLLLAIFVISLAGCGFHLRGSEPLPEVMARTHLDVSAASPLRYELESLLRSSGASVVPAGEAGAVLEVISAKIRRRTLSLDTLGRASEYGLTLLVRYRLRNSGAETQSELLSSRVERDFRFDPDNVLAQETEREMVEREMYRAVAQQMVRRLRHASLLPVDSGQSTGQ